MKKRGKTMPMREPVEVGEHTTRLGEATPRISASLELDTMLQEVVDWARELTGARYGMITTIDDSGQLQEFAFSGLTSEEYQQMAVSPDGPRLFEHLRDLQGTLRLKDLRRYVRSLGCSAELPVHAKAFQATPMRRRNTLYGSVFLAKSAGAGEFTSKDEEVVVFLASQVATAIANARAYRDERRARADLEALVNTSPVGVLVFDAKTGHPVLVNREGRRIFEDLRSPGHPVEQLLEVTTLRRADGQEVALDAGSLAELDAKTVRAEEVVFQLPDGRSVKALLNATPIHSQEGELESVVVTLQDLTPLEELDRLRAEFLGIVSHELRAPLTSIKGSAATVLSGSPLPDRAEMLQFFRIIDEQADHMRNLISDLLDAGCIDAGTLSVTPEPSGVTGLVEQSRNTFLSGGSRQTVLIDLPPDLPRVMADRPRIVQVLNNLFANAARHSPESSPIRVAAVRDGVHVAVSVADEGKGVSPETLPRLFQKYSGLDNEGEPGLRGSGLGLAICKGLVEAHGGRIWAESAGVGQGARFTFTIPVALETEEPVSSSASGSRLPRGGREPVPILVVDDDPQTLRYLRDVLTTAGYAPIVTGDHRELSQVIRTEKPHLVLLDLILPGSDGIELMDSVPELADLPVIFISAYGRDETIARALEKGAADYIVKPFSPTELTARIRAVLRRRAGPEAFMLGDLAIHYEEREVTVDGRPVQLTVTEYELLRALSANAGRVTTYDTLIRQVWGGQESGGPELVRTFVKKLRRKLDDDVARPAYIFNERGVGYRMARPDAS